MLWWVRCLGSGSRTERTQDQRSPSQTTEISRRVSHSQPPPAQQVAPGSGTSGQPESALQEPRTLSVVFSRAGQGRWRAGDAAAGARV